MNAYQETPLADLVRADSRRVRVGAAFGRLVDLPGIGPWTADYVAMRALADPDIFLPTDIGVRNALVGLGHDPAAVIATSEAWRPWRSYALMHLWNTLMPPVEEN